MIEEYFRTFSEDGEPADLVLRATVHRLGLWHKAVQVLVFNSDKEMLIQHRSANKDLYSDLWDFSVGEHLLPDEDEMVGAARGVLEELGFAAHELHTLGDPTRIECRGEKYLDREIQQSFCTVWDGPFEIEEDEVQAIRFVKKAELDNLFEQDPQRFTPWFVEQWPSRKENVVALGLFE